MATFVDVQFKLHVHCIIQADIWYIMYLNMIITQQPFCMCHLKKCSLMMFVLSNHLKF
jgi:hypothetical protein